MEPEVTPSNPIPDASQLNAADSTGADKDAISLAELNSILGKDYKDRDTALRSVKETYSFVGKRDDHAKLVKEAVQRTGLSEDKVLERLTNLMTEQTPSNDNFITKDQYLEDMFFSKNPDLNAVKDIIKPLKNASDEFKSMSWDDYVKSEKISGIVATFKTATEYQNAKSVVESNPRIGSATNKLQAAKQELNEGNYTNAKSNAVSAVIDMLQD